ncbi:MAG: hypothetical protein ABI693_27830 [Bryobacteraceae bacterium]
MLRCALFAFSCLATILPLAAQNYTITDLGRASQVTAINRFTEITGIAGNHAFLSNGVNRIDLGTLGGEYSQGQGINSFGTVTGYSTQIDGTYRAFRYSKGQMRNIGTLGGDYSVGYAINDAGQIAGSSLTANNFTRAFLWTNGQMIDLGTLGGNDPGWTTSAAGIDTAGNVVGYSYLPSGDFHGFLYTAGTMHDLGTLGGSWSQASAINDAEQITGQAYLPGNGKAHAFFYSNGTMTDLGAFRQYSSGLAISSTGVVVGQANVRTDTSYLVYHAVIFQNGMPVDLNTLIPRGLGWLLTAATGINDAGQIIGYGTRNGQSHGYLLTPL